MTSVPADRPVPRKPIDWWRWAGRVYLFLAHASGRLG